MSMLLSFLSENWQRLNLKAYGQPSKLSEVIATPRFRASAHLLFFVLSEGRPGPVLVAKVPRLPGDNSRLDQEVKNLRTVQTSRPAGFDSIPKVVAYEDYKGNRLLVQSALVNQTMRPSVVRLQKAVCVSQVLNWLIELHQTTLIKADNEGPNGFVLDHLDDLEQIFPVTKDEAELIAKTRDISEALDVEHLPLVFEHGDLSSPNILMDQEKNIGVVDWELAQPKGLPAVDLFFFLSYIAFAVGKSKNTAQCLAAFKSCFFGVDAWAIPHIVEYREALQLSPQVLRPLFVLCWSRYVASLVARLQEHSRTERLPEDSAAWLRTNRYYALWRYTVKNINDIAFG